MPRAARSSDNAAGPLAGNCAALLLCTPSTPHSFRRSWDLISLRRKPGYEYVAKYADGTGDKNQEITFNICGVISEVCAPYTVEQSGALPPYTRGIAIQYIDNVSPPPFTTCKDTNTCDFAVDPTCTAPTVGNVSCTANCEIVAPYIGAAPIFSLLDETKPQGGISLKYEGAPAYATDPFGSCPADPRTSLPAQRSFTINLLCPSDSTIADFSDIVRGGGRGGCLAFCSPPPSSALSPRPPSVPSGAV